VKSTRPQDAASLVLIALAVLVLIAVRNAHGWLQQLGSEPRSLPDLVLAHPVPVLVVLLAGAGLLAARAVATRRTLRLRTRLVLLASEDFDPAVESVVRFAGQLARLRPAVGGWLDPRARALRVLIDSDPAGRLRYSLEAPTRSIGLLRTALGSYEQVELRDPDPQPPAAGIRLEVARAELVLARPSHHPLARLDLDPDPLQAVAAALARLRPDLGDAARIAIDVRPCSPGRRRRLRARLLRAARHDSPHQPSQRPGLADLLAGGTSGRGRATAVELLERRDEVRGLQGKLGTAEPLLELQVLLECRSQIAGRPPVLLEGLLGCFDAFAAENHLRVAGLRVPGLAFLGSDLPWARRRFDRRMQTGLFAPARRGLVTPSEIAGLLKPPTARCHAPNVLRSGGAIPPPPPELPTFDGRPGLIPLGRVAGPAGDRLAGVPVADTFFSYMAGRSRYGKTETAIGQFVHLARAGHGGLFLDPHADAIAEIKTYLTDPGVRERVVAINLADRGADQAQAAWNLSAHGLPAHEAADKVEAVVDAMASALRWDERNTRALNLATQAAQALVELSQALPPELAPTVFQLPTLLSDEDWRAAVLPHLAPATRQFFEQRFPRLPAEAVTAVTNLIDRLRAARPVAALLGSPISTYDVRHAMDQGLIVLACPGSGSTRDRLVANFLVYDVLHAAKGRAAMPPERRKAFWVFLDELQTYDGPNLPALLEQSAKYGGRAFLFNQNPERLTDATLNAVTTNRSHLLTTTVNAKAAALLAREWGGDPTPQTVTQLDRYTYLASVTVGARATKPFLVRGVPAAELHAEHRHPDGLGALEQAITEHGRRRPVKETIAALDDHDQRILRHLQGQPAAAGLAGHDSDGGGGQQRVRTQPVARRAPKEPS